MYKKQFHFILLYSAGVVALDMLEPKFDVKLPSSSGSEVCSCLIIVNRLCCRWDQNSTNRSNGYNDSY